MSWFHFSKQDRLQRNRQIRRETAEDARKEAAENPWMIGRQVTDVLKRAVDEERTFTEYMGEPMPPHILAALQLEIGLWRRILVALEKADTKHMDEHEYNALQEDIRALLLCLINILHAEEEMLHSCLVRHYTRIIESIKADAARVTR